MNTIMLKRLAAILTVTTVLGLTGCFSPYKAPPHYHPDDANLPDPPSGERGNPISTPVVPVPVAYKLIRPATTVDWSSAKVQPDIYHLEHDVSKALEALKPTNWSAEQMIRRGEFETLEQYHQRIASMKNATSKVYYMIVKSDFMYNIDTKQFLVLPQMSVDVPVKATTEVTKSVPDTSQRGPKTTDIPPPAPGNPATPAMDDYYEANELYNAGNFPKASKAYMDFVAKHPAHEKILHVQLGLALSHFSMRQLDTAEPELERLSTNPNAPMPTTVKLLLENCREIRASGKKVNSAVFKLKLEEKPKSTLTPEAPKECSPPEAPDTHKPKHAPFVVPELPSPAASTASVRGLFRPWETPPTALTLLHQYEAHPTFFKTGVLIVDGAREEWEVKHKKEGHSGWLLPDLYEPPKANTLRGDLRLVAGCRLVRQPNSSMPGNYRDAFQLVSLHVVSVDGNNKVSSVHYAADLESVVAP